MENTEIMNNQELEVMDNDEVVETNEDSGLSKGVIALGIVALVGLGIAAAKGYKKRFGTRDERRAKALAKKGWLVTPPEVVDEESVEADYVEVEEATEE
jgi:hypothetical protein